LGNAASFLKACFAGRTPLLTPGGARFIEEIQEGDYVLSRDEFHVTGDVVPKQVEEVFRSKARIWHVHVGGQVIRTTGEHPFYVQSEGWTAAQNLRIGNLLSSHDGQWVAVEDLLDTGESELVFNLRVSDFHTYFVGSREWGFSAWAHNACDLSKLKKLIPLDFAGNWKGQLAATKESAIFYMLFDKTGAGRLLKIGTTAVPNALERMSGYLRRAAQAGVELEAFISEIPLGERKAVENGIRGVIGNVHEMPWDRTGGRLAGWILGRSHY
jgi:hypothetical protein